MMGGLDALYWRGRRQALIDEIDQRSLPYQATIRRLAPLLAKGHTNAVAREMNRLHPVSRNTPLVHSLLEHMNNRLFQSSLVLKAVSAAPSQLVCWNVLRRHGMLVAIVPATNGVKKHPHGGGEVALEIDVIRATHEVTARWHVTAALAEQHTHAPAPEGVMRVRLSINPFRPTDLFGNTKRTLEGQAAEDALYRMSSL